MFGAAIALLLNLGAMIGYLIFTGIGVWGNNSPVGWGWPIVNFVFWRFAPSSHHYFVLAEEKLSCIVHLALH